MFKLISDISIGKYRYIRPIDVKVNKSIFDFVDKAIIRIPTAARIMSKQILVKEKSDTATLFNEGDPVHVLLGYNNILRTEFRGFVTKVNHTTPVTIECEGYAYQLRNRIFKTVYLKTTLKKVLTDIIAGTDIKLGEIPGVPIDKLTINAKSGTEVLLMLRNYYKLEFYFTGNILAANLLYLRRDANVKYRLGFNVIKADELKLKNGNKAKVTVRFLSDEKSGKKVKGSISASGSNKEEILKVPNISDPKALRQIAEKHSYELNYGGYEGKISCFLAPFCQVGDRAHFEDPKHQEKNGNYYIQATEVTYGVTGARRLVTIGAKLSSDVQTNK